MASQTERSGTAGTAILDAPEVFAAKIETRSSADQNDPKRGFK